MELLRVTVLLSVALAACSAAVLTATVPPTVAPTATAAPAATAIPTPSTVICDAFDVVNYTISPAFEQASNGTITSAELADRIGAAAQGIRRVAEDEPNPVVRGEIEKMAALV